MNLFGDEDDEHDDWECDLGDECPWGHNDGEFIVEDGLNDGSGWTTKDSGVRAEYPSGMVRDTDKGKPRYDLIPIPILKRWAELAARGAEKYGDNNWMKANSQEELFRFAASALRHMFQWLDGDDDEDHAAAVLWNVAAAEIIKEKLNG